VNQQNPSSTVGVDDFFDNIGGTGAPTAWLSEIGHGVIGTIESQRTVDYIPFGKKDPEVLDDGRTRKQLVVILQTDQRNWDGVKEAPWVDREDHSKGRKPASEDDGRRAVYVEPWTNIHAAVGKAVKDANNGQAGPVKNGAKLGVKITGLKDTGKGNPLKLHAAFYEPPAVGSEFFNQTSAPESAPAAQEAPAAQPEAPKTEAAPAAAAPTDPWSGQPAAGGSKPPF
jgi:hypothetical protein